MDLNTYILGTYRYYYPSLNPVGWYSITVLCVGVVLTAVCSKPAPHLIRRIGLVIAPLLLLIITGMNPASPVNLFFHSFRYGESDAALTLSIAFGFGISLMNFRERSLTHQLVGSLGTWAFGTLTVFFTTVGLSVILQLDPIPSICLTGLSMVLCFLYHYNRLKRMFVRQRRLAKNLCVYCGYDLRGSIGQPTCPECGGAMGVGHGGDCNGGCGMAGGE